MSIQSKTIFSHQQKINYRARFPLSYSTAILLKTIRVCRQRNKGKKHDYGVFIVHKSYHDYTKKKERKITSLPYARYILKASKPIFDSD